MSSVRILAAVVLFALAIPSIGTAERHLLPLGRPSLEESITNTGLAVTLPRINNPWIDPALRTKSSGPIDVILELSSPSIVQLKLAAADGLAYTSAVAELERTVARQSRLLGAFSIEGLSHYPMLRMLIAADRLEAVTSQPGVVAAYWNRPMFAARAEGGVMIGAFQLQAQYAARGAGVGVAIFDTGVDAEHPELASRIVAGIDVTEGGDPFGDVQGHGTHVSGIVHGMAPDAHLFSFKVLDDNGSGSIWGLISGLNVAYANRNAFGGIKVINVSIQGGSPVNKDCDKAHPGNGVFNLLYKAGIVVVFSSGNHGFLNGVSDFACHSKTLAVGAVYDADIGPQDFPPTCQDDATRAGQIACYSDSGLPLDVLAPANNAVTTAPGGGYIADFGGTSAAAPYVSGLVAQIRSRIPKANPAKIFSALKNTGTLITDINGIARRLVNGPAAYKKLGGKTEL